jgi:hypothetical protein
MKKLGRKFRYGEPTKKMSIPVSMVPEIEKLLERRETVSCQIYEVIQYPPAVQQIINRTVELFRMPMMVMIDALRENGCSDDRLALVEKELFGGQWEAKSLAAVCVGSVIDEAREIQAKAELS